MKSTIILAIAVLLIGSAGFAQTTKSHSHKARHHSTAVKKYTCTMHPEVVKSKPGKCPKCGMALVPMKMKKMDHKKSMEGMKM